MRLRRLELVVIALTLAFACFIGGFFTGRSFNAVSIEGVAPTQLEAVATPAAAGEPEVLALRDSQQGAASAVEWQPGDGGNARGDGQAQTQQPEVPPGAPIAGDGRININTASKNELMDLPGIGPALADRIIEYRSENGGFSVIEDIMKVSGIAEGKFAKLEDKITV